MSTPEPRLAREGLLFYAVPGLITLVCLAARLWPFAALGCVVTVAVALFFRNPRRQPPSDPKAFISPADGTVVGIRDEIDPPYRLEGQRSRCVSIFLSVFNVHMNRYPCDGTIEDSRRQPGKFFAAYRAQASQLNEQRSTVIRLTNDIRVAVVQITGWIARRIVCYARAKEHVRRGQLMGLIRFGSRVDVWMPIEWTLLVTPGQRVRGGETILAKMDTP